MLERPRGSVHRLRPLSRYLLLLGAAAIFCGHAWTYRGYLLDDAYISLRYAQNLVEGHGLVWNPDERVEGYTNFLWVLLGALFLKLDLNAIVGLQAISALSVLALLALTHRLGQITGASSVAPAGIWLLSAEALGYFATTAMETTFFTLLATAAIYLGLREAQTGRRMGSVAVFILLSLTRPEGLMLFALCQGLFALAERQGRQSWGFRRRTIDVSIFSLAIGAWIGWRYAFYGELLPNTYHAKVTGGAEQLSGGLIYLRDGALYHPVFALAMLGLAVLLVRPEWRTHLRRPEVPTLWLLAVVWLGYVLAVGGDSMPFHRFLMPMLPWVAVLTSVALEVVVKIWRPLGVAPRPLVLAGLLLVAQSVAGQRSEEPMRAFVAHRTTLVGLETGRHLAAERPATDLLAVNTAGALPWASRLPSLDMLGLTDLEIARRDVYVISPRWSGHRRGWGDYVLSRRPDVIVWYNSAGAREPHYLGDHQLADDPAFRFFYQLRRVELPAIRQGEVEPSSSIATDAVARFPGTPFGAGTDGDMISPNLGLRLEIRPASPWRARPRPTTFAYDAPILFHYFEQRPAHQPLWPLLEAADGDLNRFLDTVVQRWRIGAKAFDPQARRDVERLCEQALNHVQAGRILAAKETLSLAAARNSTARSPLVGQYIANLAVAENNLFLAVQAQLEALRLAPNNKLYRVNLERLLTVPLQDFIHQDRRAEATDR